MNKGQKWDLMSRLCVALSLCVLLAVVVLLNNTAFCQDADSSDQKQKAVKTVYPWQKDTDLIDFAFKFYFQVEGDETGLISICRLLPPEAPDNLHDRDLACLSKWPTLETATIGGNRISAAALQHLRLCTKLEYLDFYTFDSRGFDGKGIAYLVGKKGLRWLILVGPNISLARLLPFFRSLGGLSEGEK